MSKRIVIALIAFTLGMHLTGCSSGGQKDDSDVAQSNDKEFAQEGEGDFADDSSKSAKADAPPPADDKAPGDMDLEQTPAAKPGDQASAPPPPPAEDELSLDEPGSLPDGVGADKDKAAKPGDQAAVPPPTDEPLFSGDSAPPPTDTAAAPTDTTPPATTAESAPPPEVAPAPEPAPVATAPEKEKKAVTYAPLQKVKDSAFTQGGTNLNRVYIGRPHDTVKAISQKIYGSNRSKDLVSWNSFLKRGVRTGDKIYYSSPANPSDTRMLTYYEDIGAPPQTYTSKDGDNIRKVSSKLLGFKDAWKEVYETNMNVESRGNIPAGLELKYWPDQGSAPSQTMAQNSPPDQTLPPQDLPPSQPADNMQSPPPPPPPVAGNNVPPQDPAMAPPPPPPPGPPGQQAVANNNDPLAPPPDMSATPASVGNTAAVPPPPPPPSGNDPLAPPPGPKPAKAAGKKVVAEDASGYDADTMMVIGLGGILIIAAAFVWVVIRKNRAKRMDLGQTQV
jgi:hypothetical protein